MTVLLLDTNVVSILFKPDHSLHQKCLRIATGRQWFISFMTCGHACVLAGIMTESRITGRCCHVAG
jgi:predicted nucleic acid-binding protein